MWGNGWEEESIPTPANWIVEVKPVKPAENMGQDFQMVKWGKTLLQIKSTKPVVENELSGRSNPLKQSVAAQPTLKEHTIARAVSSALAVLCGMLYNLPARLRWHGHCLEERIELWCVKGI